jgi:hypothetical protein
MRSTWELYASRAGAAMRPVGSFFVAHPTLTQGVYYLLLGLWPLVSIETYQSVAGPRTDLWLVRIVAALMAVLGGTFCLAAYRRRTSPEVVFLAVGCASALAVLEVVFVYQRVISGVYLLEAAAELGLLALWGYSWAGGHVNREERAATPPMAIPLAPPPAGTSVRR